MPPLSLVLQLVLIISSQQMQALGSSTGKSQCRSLCSACQSLRPAHINRICSLDLLNGCECPEYALNLTTVAATAVNNDSCPATDERTADVGFCPYGQQTNSAGCPLPACRAPPSCASSNSDHQLQLPAGCQLYCPAGYQVDARSGCPVCRCRCPYRSRDDETDTTGAFEADRSCAAACAAIPAAAAADKASPAAVGYRHKLIAVPSSDSSGNRQQDCPVCACIQLAPPPAPPANANQKPCLLRCPNSCGGHGYADAEARDERGCVRDCACKCPLPGQACPNDGDRCLRWEVDPFGCRVCAVCGNGGGGGGGIGCVTKATLAATASSDVIIDRLCQSAGCSTAVTATMRLTLDAGGCLRCSCEGQTAALHQHQQQHDCAIDPRLCAIRCGPHPALLDARGCPLDNACQCDCPRLRLDACLLLDGGCAIDNITVAKDAYGCYACRCATGTATHPAAAAAAPALVCPLEAEFRRRCAPCGPHGFETDPVSGCQTSCQCDCHQSRRRSASAASASAASPAACSPPCFYGTRRDRYGCDTCECISAAEYLQQFLNF